MSCIKLNSFATGAIVRAINNKKLTDEEVFDTILKWFAEKHGSVVYEDGWDTDVKAKIHERWKMAQHRAALPSVADVAAMMDASMARLRNDIGFRKNTEEDFDMEDVENLANPEAFKILTETDTFDDIISEKLDGMESRIKDVKERFHKAFYRSVLADFENGELLNFADAEKLDLKVKAFKISLLENADLTSVEDKLGPDTTIAEHMLANPQDMDAYIDAIVANNFDLLLNRYFNGLVKKVGDKYVSSVKNFMPGDWTNKEEYADGFEGVGEITKLHLLATPQVSFSGIQGGMQSASVVKDTISEHDFKKTIADLNLFDTLPDSSSIGDMLWRSHRNNPIAMGIYARFYSPRPVMVDGKQQHSFQSIYLSEILKHGKVTERAKAARDIMNNFSSALVNTFRANYISYYEGKLDYKKPNTPDAIFNDIIDDIANSVNKRLLSGIQVDEKSNTVAIRLRGSFSRVFRFDGKGSNIAAKLDDGGNELTVKEVKLLLENVGLKLPAIGRQDLVSAFYAYGTIEEQKAAKQNMIDLIVRNALTLNANKIIGTAAKPEAPGDQVKKDLENYFTQVLKYEPTSNDLRYTLYDGDGNLRPVIDPRYTNRELLGRLKQVVERVNGIAENSTVLNAEGNMIAKYILGSVVNHLPSRIKRLRAMGGSTYLANNQFVTGELQLLDLYIKDGYSGDNSRKKKLTQSEMLDPGMLADFNINGLYGNSVFDEGSNVFMDFFVPADKKKYTVPRVQLGRHAMPLKDDGTIDRKVLKQHYYDTVAQSYFTQADNILSAWNTMLQKNGLIDQPIADIYALENMLKERSAEIKPFVASSKLVSNFDYVYDKQKNIRLRPDFLHLLHIHQTPKLLRAYLAHREDSFIKNLKDTGFRMDKTLIRKFDEKVAGTGVKTKSRGLSIEKEIEPGKVRSEHHPLLISYFYNFNIISNQLSALHQGNIFNYKPGKAIWDIKGKPGTVEYFSTLDRAVHDSYIDMVKRAVSMSSTFHKPILQSTDHYTGLPSIGDGSLLPYKSKIAYFNDVKEFAELLSNGELKDQEIFDGAFHIHYLERLKTMNSYGAGVAGMESMILKDFTPDFDMERGINHLEKKASYTMTPEYMLRSRNNGKFDMDKMNRIMLGSVTFHPMIHYGNVSDRYSNINDLAAAAGSPEALQAILDAYKDIIHVNPDTGELRPYVTINNERFVFNNMLEVFDHLVNAYRGGKLESEYDYEWTFKTILSLEESNPQIANQYISKVGFTTSVKSGLRSVNKPLMDLITEAEADTGKSSIVWDEVSNENTGIQLNPDHDPRQMEDVLRVVTQKLMSLAYEGKHPEETYSVYGALAELSNYMVDKNIDQTGASLLSLAKNKLLARGDGSDNLFQKLRDESWNLSDPSVYRSLSTMMAAVMSRVGVEQKFAGGQFVVTPVSNVVMVYETVDPDGEVRVMDRVQYVKYMESLGKDPDGPEAVKPRNLKWTEYYRTLPDGTVEDLKSRPEWQNLVNTFNTQQAVINNQDISQEEKAQARADYNAAKRAYWDLLDSGEWTARPAEVFLPNVFAKYFNNNTVIDINKVRASPRYFDNLVTKRRGEPAERELLNELYASGKIKTKSGQRLAREYNEKINAFWAENRVISDQLRESFLKLLDMDSARVPGTGKQSASPVRIVGFLNSLRNSIGIPMESMIVKGEDLDIDKSYVQMMEAIHKNKQGRKSLYSGMVYPFFTVDREGNVYKNEYKGRAATRDEIAESFPEDIAFLEGDHVGGDWYASHLRNFITGQTIEILKSGRNAIEANTPVSMDVSKEIADSRPIVHPFAPDDPVTKERSAMENKAGQKMVGIAATGMKGYSALYQAAKMFGNSEEPIATFLGVPITNIANSEDKYYNMQAWQYMSEVVNASVDNAKHLILGRVNLKPDTANFAIGILAFGVPLKSALNLIMDPMFPKALQERYEGDPDKRVATKRLEKEFKMGPGDFHKLYAKAQQFYDMASMLSVNQGLKSTPEDMYKYIRRLPIDGVNYIISDDVTRKQLEQEAIGNPLSGVAILAANPHFAAMVKHAYRTFIEMSQLFPNEAANEITDIYRAENPFGDTAKFHRHAQDVASKILSDNYLKSVETSINGKQYKMYNPAHRREFTEDFKDYLAQLREQFPDNDFLRLLKPMYNRNFSGGTVTSYHVMGLRTMDDDTISMLKISLNKLPMDVKRNLHIMDVIMNNAAGSRSYSRLFKNDVLKRYNQSISKMDRDLNYDSIYRFAQISFDEDYDEYHIPDPGSQEPVEEMSVNKKYHVYNSYGQHIGSNVYGRFYEGDTVKRDLQSGIPFTVVDGTLLSQSTTSEFLNKVTPAKHLAQRYREAGSHPDPLRRTKFTNTADNSVQYYPQPISNKFIGMEKGVDVITTPDRIRELTPPAPEVGQYMYRIKGEKEIRPLEIVVSEPAALSLGDAEISEDVYKVRVRGYQPFTMVGRNAWDIYGGRIASDEELNNQVIVLGRDIEFTGVVDPTVAPELKATRAAVLDEQGIWESVPDADERNRVLAEAYEKFEGGNLIVNSVRYYPAPEGQLKALDGTEEGFEVSGVTKSAVSPLYTKRILENMLSNITGTSSVIVETQSFIDEMVPDPDNGFTAADRQKDMFHDGKGNLVINSDRFSLDTPIGSLSRLWMHVLREKQNFNLLYKFVNFELSEEIVTSLEAKGLAGDEIRDAYIGELIERGVYDSESFRDRTDEFGTMNEYLTTIEKYIGTNALMDIGNVGLQTMERINLQPKEQKVLSDLYIGSLERNRMAVQKQSKEDQKRKCR